jgi:hypothetical protein
MQRRFALNWRFGTTFRSHSQGSSCPKTRPLNKFARFVIVQTCWYTPTELLIMSRMIVWFTLRPWWWDTQAVPKRWYLTKQRCRVKTQKHLYQTSTAAKAFNRILTVVWITEIQCVYCAARAELSNINQVQFFKELHKQRKIPEKCI